MALQRPQVKSKALSPLRIKVNLSTKAQILCNALHNMLETSSTLEKGRQLLILPSLQQTLPASEHSGMVYVLATSDKLYFPVEQNKYAYTHKKGTPEQRLGTGQYMSIKSLQGCMAMQHGTSCSWHQLFTPCLCSEKDQ